MRIRAAFSAPRQPFGRPPLIALQPFRDACEYLDSVGMPSRFSSSCVHRRSSSTARDRVSNTEAPFFACGSGNLIGSALSRGMSSWTGGFPGSSESQSLNTPEQFVRRPGECGTICGCRGIFLQATFGSTGDKQDNQTFLGRPECFFAARCAKRSATRDIESDEDRTPWCCSRPLG